MTASAPAGSEGGSRFHKLHESEGLAAISRAVREQQAQGVLAPRQRGRPYIAFTNHDGDAEEQAQASNEAAGVPLLELMKCPTVQQRQNFFYERVPQLTHQAKRHRQARTLDSGAVKVSAVACTDVVGELLKCQEEGHEPVQLPGADELAALSTEILEEYASRASDFGDRVVQSIAQIVRHRLAGQSSRRAAETQTKITSEFLMEPSRPTDRPGRASQPRLGGTVHRLIEAELEGADAALRSIEEPGGDAEGVRDKDASLPLWDHVTRIEQGSRPACGAKSG